MAKNLAGKVIWVTGASSGIGREIALEAAAQGARVLLSSRRREALDEVARECRERGGEAAAVLAFDLEVPDARAEACEAAPGCMKNAAISGRLEYLLKNRKNK